MKRSKGNSESGFFWISTGDLMAGVLFIFVLLFVMQLLNVQSELETKEEIINELASAKNKVISRLSGEFDKDSLKVKINPKDGSIELDEKILFDSNKSILKKKGKTYLEEFIPKYVDLLLGDAGIRDSLDRIVIEGYTDDVGSYFYNLELSQKRAYAVVDFIFNDMNDFKYKNILKKYITANGRSNNNLRYYDDGTVDRDKSRRVEFQFKLKTEETLDKVMETLKK
jgi:chemotaxis protein MotB